MPRVLLVNTNAMQPPVAPIGLDYVGSALEAAGIEVSLLDLAFVAGAQHAAPLRSLVQDELIRATERYTPDVVGLTVRNTDDCCLATRDFFLPRIADWIALLKRHCQAPIVVGGIGFSVMPREAFAFVDADYGIAGDGEQAFPRLVHSLKGDRLPPYPTSQMDDITGLLWRKPDGEVMFNPPVPADASQWPLSLRRLADNARYVREGGMVGIETKRGCPAGCIYCADPVAKGRQSRLRPPRIVVEEIRDLLAQGADIYHTCDSEFNLPGDHGRAVCEAVIEAGLGERIRWFAYCSPIPFDEPTARLYRRAGCRGINFGTDSGNDAMLARLGRAHRRSDIVAAVAATRAAGMSCMLDLLLGGPGESRESLRETIELARSCGADRVGLSVGIRIYPGTSFARNFLECGGTTPLCFEAEVGGGRLEVRKNKAASCRRTPKNSTPSLLEPHFWIEPSLGDSIHDVVRELVADDPRFFFMDPSRADANYNYNDNAPLVAAIRRGYRGAFWDILRRVAENLPPE
jgi:hypothetical protein